MSKAYKCDFCESLFAINENIPNSIRFGWGERGELSYRDICPACLAEIARGIDIDAGLRNTKLDGIKKKVMPYARPRSV